MKKALIGYTGFVGGNLKENEEFTHFYNSKNIETIKGESFDIVYCCGISAVKWLANKNEKEDLEKIKNLLQNLKMLKAKKFVLISTVDVYKNPLNVNEDTAIEADILDPYGKNRYFAENEIKSYFKDVTIVRLPGLFGKGLKKNVIFDLLNNNCLEMINLESSFQYYNLKYLAKDIKTVLQNDIKLINFATCPIKTKNIVEVVFNTKNFNQITKNPPVSYDMKTKYASLFNKKGDYIYNKEEIIEDLKNFKDGYKNE